MARPSLNEIRSVGDYATTYQWNLEVSRFPPAALLFPGIDAINVRCSSMDVPKATITPIETNLRGHITRQSGTLVYNSPLTLTFNETVDNTIQRWFSNWRNACTQMNTGAHNTKNDVSATMRLVRLDRQDKAIWAYILYGCQYEDADLGQVASDAANFQPVLTMSYDYFEDAEI